MGFAYPDIVCIKINNYPNTNMLQTSHRQLRQNMNQVHASMNSLGIIRKNTIYFVLSV